LTARSGRLAAGLVGLALALFAPLFQGQVLSSQDIARVYTPIAALLGASLRSFDLSRLVWNPDLGAGFPLVADGAATPFHLPLWPFVVALPPDQALTATLLFGYAAAACAMAAFARALGRSVAAAAVAGVGYAWGGFAVGHVVHVNIVAGLPFLPLVLLGLERARTSPTPMRPAVLAGLAWGFLCLGGHPQVALLTASTGLAYAAFRFWPCVDEPAAARVGLRVVSLFLAIGAGIAAVYYLPMAELAAQSVRPGSGFSQPPGATYSLPAAHLVTALTPFFFYEAPGTYRGAWNPAEMALYPGVVVLLLAGLGLVANRRVPEVRFFALLAFAGIVLALGDATPVHRLLEFLPVFRSMRAPARYVLLTHLGVCVLAAAGLDALRALTTTQRRWAASAALGLGLIALALAFMAPTALGAQTSDRWQDFQTGAVSILWPARRALPVLWLALCALLLAAFPASRPSLLATLFAALVALDHGAFAATALRPHWVRAGGRTGPAPSTADGGRTYVVTSPEPWRGASNRALLDGYAGLDLYVSLPLRRHTDYMQAFWLRDQAAPALLQAAAVDTVVDGWRQSLDPRLRLEGTEFSPRYPIATVALGGRVAFDMAGAEADSIQLVTALKEAAALAQGDVAARLRLTAVEGPPLVFDIRAGIETAERRVEEGPRHEVPRSSLAAWSRVDQAPEGRFYVARFWWPEARRMARVELEYAAPAGRLLVFGGFVGSAAAERALTPFLAEPYVRTREADGRVRYELTGARARASAVHRLVRVAGAAEAIRVLADGPGTALEAVRLEDPSAPEPQGRGPSRVTITSDGPLRVELMAEMKGSGFVVLADSHYPGWEAQIDGARAPVYAADGLFRAVFVPDGTHRVVFRYLPRPLFVGLAVAVLTLAAAALLVWRGGAGRYS
jgi:hypothetical protein